MIKASHFVKKICGYICNIFSIIISFLAFVVTFSCFLLLFMLCFIFQICIFVLMKVIMLLDFITRRILQLKFDGNLQNKNYTFYKLLNVKSSSLDLDHSSLRNFLQSLTYNFRTQFVMLSFYFHFQIILQS